MARLQTALQGCSAFVLLYGREGVRRWVGAEVQYALSRNLSPHDAFTACRPKWQTDFDGSEGECAKPDAASNRRVSRGGSWLYDTVFSRPSARLRLNSDNRTNFVGLRVLRASRTP